MESQHNPNRVNRRIYFLFPNQIRRFRTRLGYWPNVTFPVTYFEKVLWRKVFDHNPLFRIFCNKLKTRDYIRKRLPDLKLPRLLWRGTNLSDAPDSLFTENLVIKAAHSCNRNLFHSEVSADGVAEAKKELARAANPWMRHTYGRQHYQWGYFAPEREILAEEWLEPSGPQGLVEITVRCANGKALAANASIDKRNPSEQDAYYSIDGSRLVCQTAAGEDRGTLPESFELPSYFPDLVKAAETLSEGLDYGRFDFLCNTSGFFGGEITVYPGAGVKLASQWWGPGPFPGWDLRQSWFLRHPQEGWRGEYAEVLREEVAKDAAAARETAFRLA